MIALLLDTETTGLIDNRSRALDIQPEVIEFFGMLVNLDKPAGKVLSHLHCMIKPLRPFREVRETEGKGKSRKTITEITGITNDMLKKCRPFFWWADKIIGYIEAAPCVIAQNASFDKEVLDMEAERLKRLISWPPVICTIEQSVHYKGYRMNLGDLHEYLTGDRFEGAHRATEDVEALLRVCVEMRKRGDL